MAVSMASTSVPRWSAQTLADIEFDVHATRHLIFAAGPDALAHIADNADVLPERAAIVDVGGSSNSEALIADELSAARVGWRFVVVGSGAVVMRLAALIVAAGAIDAEIDLVHLGEADGFGALERDVFCSHCHTVTPTNSRIDESLICSGCGVEVVVYHHFSRRHAAYLGFRPDSEELTGAEDEG